MLSLTRHVGEAIRIGDDIEIRIIAIKGGGVRLGISAPREVPVNREEVYQRIAEANTLAAVVTGDFLAALTASLPDDTTPQAADPA